MDDFLVPKGLTDIKPLREIIYEHLHQAILEGLIKPGQRLVERDIAEKFNASRTPVREALRLLESEGFIEYLPRKGVIVRGFNVKEIEDIYNIRKVLECLAVQNAIQHITDNEIDELKNIINRIEQAQDCDVLHNTSRCLHEFDDIIVNAANMPLLKTFLQTLKESLLRYQKINLSKHPRRKEAVKEHKDILQAIIDRDVHRAEFFVCLHITNSCRELLHLTR